MASEKNTLVALGVVAAIGIVAAFVIGYYVGTYSYSNYGMMGPGGGMMGSGGMMGGMMGSGMMGPGVMGPGMMGPGAGIQSATQNTVIITNYAFYPDILTVRKGTTVTWINMDPVPHTVEAGTHEKPTGKFESQLLGRMESFSYTFTEPGTYVYHCDPHPYMTGKIIVEG